MAVDRTAEVPARVRPGRPRSEQARAAVVRATSELLHEIGLRAMTTEQIAARSGVSKATIYKWWPNKYAVAIDAFLSEILADSPDPDTGSARRDFTLLLQGVCHFYTGPSGQVFAQLIGEAQFDREVASELQDGLIQTRRATFRAIWDRGVARGELRPDVDADIAIDLIIGPALYRLMIGHAGLDDAAAATIVDTAIRGLSV